jgi:hypothetical protein
MSLLSTSGTGGVFQSFRQVPCFIFPPRPKNNPNVPTSLFPTSETQPTIPSDWKPPKTKYGATNHVTFLKRQNDEEEDGVIFIVENIGKTLSSPVPGISPSLAVGYPLALVASLIVFPISYSIVLIGFFGLFAYLGRTLVLEDGDVRSDGSEETDLDLEDDDEDDDESRPKTDLLAFAAAIISTGLLSPENTPATTGIPQSNLLLVLAGALGLGGYVLLAGVPGGRSTAESDAMDSTKNLEQNIMTKWDDSLREGDSDDRRK